MPPYVDTRDRHKVYTALSITTLLFTAISCLRIKKAPPNQIWYCPNNQGSQKLSKVLVSFGGNKNAKLIPLTINATLSTPTLSVDLKLSPPLNPLRPGFTMRSNLVAHSAQLERFATNFEKVKDFPSAYVSTLWDKLDPFSRNIYSLTNQLNRMGFDVSITNTQSKSPVRFHTDSATTLIHHAFDTPSTLQSFLSLNPVNQKGQSLFHHSVALNKIDEAKKLFSLQDIINFRHHIDYNGFTPFMSWINSWILNTKDQEIVPNYPEDQRLKDILNFLFNTTPSSYINHQDNQGNTILHHIVMLKTQRRFQCPLSAHKGSCDTVAFYDDFNRIVQHDPIDPFVRNKQHQTALDLLLQSFVPKLPESGTKVFHSLPLNKKWDYYYDGHKYHCFHLDFGNPYLNSFYHSADLNYGLAQQNQYVGCLLKRMHSLNPRFFDSQRYIPLLVDHQLLSPPTTDAATDALNKSVFCDTGNNIYRYKSFVQAQKFPTQFNNVVLLAPLAHSGASVFTTPLIEMVKSNNFEAVKTLLQNGADPNFLPSHMGLTFQFETKHNTQQLLQIARESTPEGSDSPVFKILVAHGAVE